MSGGAQLNFLDSYTLQARIAPAVVVMLPLGFALGSWFPGNSIGRDSLIVAIVTLGLAPLIAQLGREFGRRKEQELFASWGGTPTTRQLSHLFSALDTKTLARYHSKLQALVPDLKLPTKDDELRNPSAAWEAYESSVLFLREKTRDRRKYPLVLSENTSYGFRRNLWAMKKAGVLLAATGLLSCTLSLAAHLHASHAPEPIDVVGLAVNLSLLLAWTRYVNSKWVGAAAYAYADRLLGSLDSPG
jgi:hypothetical protein